MYFVTLALTKFGMYTSTMHMTRYIHTVADIQKYTHTHTRICVLLTLAASSPVNQ